MELEYADEIYIFVSEDMKGLKFIDRTPSEAEQKFAGKLPEGVFHSDIHSMSQAEWDEEVNEPNGTKLIHYRDGSNNARTYMVSAEKFQEILQTIMVAQKDGKGEFVIDTRDREKEVVKDSEVLETSVEQKLETTETKTTGSPTANKKSNKEVSPEESLIKMINDNRDALLANGFTEQDIEDALQETSINMDDKIVQHLFLIESLKSFGVMDESKLVQLDQRIGGGYFTDGDIYGYDVTYDEKQYRIVLEEKDLPPKESLEFGKTDNLEMLLKQKEMLEKFRGFYNSRTMRQKLAQVNKQIETIQERGTTKGEEVEGQTASKAVVTSKDIAEADTENRIASSEIYEANKHLYTHKEYEKYTNE